MRTIQRIISDIEQEIEEHTVDLETTRKFEAVKREIIPDKTNINSRGEPKLGVRGRQAASYRTRLLELEETLTTDTKQVIPSSIVSLIKDSLNEKDARIVLEEMDQVLKLESITPPQIDKGKTKGDWSTSLPDFTDDHRPYDALSFEIIEEMLKSAPVRFALEMKRSQILAVFRNERSWTIISPDKELSEITRHNLIRILPKMALDFSYSSLVYGVSFQELVWEYATKYELGISSGKTNKSFLVSKIPNAVNPTKVRAIRRTASGNFNGFIQRTELGSEDITVSRDASLIIPYNERFRNLWGESFLLPMYPIWFWYEVILRSMVKYMERMGTPVAVVKAPARSTVIKPGTTTKVDGITWGMEIASNVSRSNAAVIPSDTDDNGKPLWSLEYLSSTEKSQPFLDILELLTQMILRAGLSADRALSQSSGGVGSYSIGEIHQQATSLHNELILIQWLHYLNTYFLPLYSLYNRGIGGPPIWMETQGLDTQDIENLKSLLNISTNLDSFKDFTYRIDWESLLTVNNIPILTETEAKQKKETLLEEARKKQEMFIEVQQEGAGTAVNANQKPDQQIKDQSTNKSQDNNTNG